MGVARHFALYRLNFEFVRNQRGPVFGRNSTAQLLEKAPIQTTRFRHDFDRLAQFRFDNGPTDVRMVSISKIFNKMTRIGKTLLYRYDAERHNQKICRYNRNTGYVIYSAMGSFFIPMVVMLYVYVRISCVIAQRHDQLSHINTSFTRVSQWFFCNEQFFYSSTFRRASKTVWQSRSLISNEYPVKLRKATQGKSWKNYGNKRIVGCLAYSTLWTFLRFFLQCAFFEFT